MPATLSRSRWTRAERQLLEQHWQTHTPAELADLIGRSLWSVRKRLQRSALNWMPRWSEEEVDQVKRWLAEGIRPALIAERLGNRSQRSVFQKCIGIREEMKQQLA